MMIRCCLIIEYKFQSTGIVFGRVQTDTTTSAKLTTTLLYYILCLNLLGLRRIQNHFQERKNHRDALGNDALTK